MTYRDCGGRSFEPPWGWSDKTVFAWTAPPDASGSVTNLTATRESRKPGETVFTLARRQLLQLSTRLSEFELLDVEDFEIDQCRATRSLFRWKNEKGPVEQAVAHLESLGDESTVLTITCTSRPNSEWPAREVLRHVLATARVDRGRPSKVPPANSGFFDINDLPSVPMPRGYPTRERRDR
jgi:hypothetical protein